MPSLPTVGSRVCALLGCRATGVGRALSFVLVDGRASELLRGSRSQRPPGEAQCARPRADTPHGEIRGHIGVERSGHHGGVGRLRIHPPATHRHGGLHDGVTRHGRLGAAAEFDDDDREIALRADQRHTDLAPSGWVRLHLRSLPSDNQPIHRETRPIVISTSTLVAPELLTWHPTARGPRLAHPDSRRNPLSLRSCRRSVRRICRRSPGRVVTQITTTGR